jgi:hypothetical protein
MWGQEAQGPNLAAFEQHRDKAAVGRKKNPETVDARLITLVKSSPISPGAFSAFHYINALDGG